MAFTKLSRDVPEETFTGFIDEHNLTFPNGLEDAGKTSEIFKVNSIPAGAIVKDGVVVWRGNPAALKEADYRAIIGS